MGPIYSTKALKTITIAHSLHGKTSDWHQMTYATRAGVDVLVPGRHQKSPCWLNEFYRVMEILLCNIHIGLQSGNRFERVRERSEDQWLVVVWSHWQVRFLRVIMFKLAISVPSQLVIAIFPSVTNSGKHIELCFWSRRQNRTIWIYATRYKAVCGPWHHLGKSEEDRLRSTKQDS